MSDKHFPLNHCFQSADDILSASYKSLADIRAHCIVTLDANVLLAPYGLGAKPLAEIVGIYRSLANGGRLALPAQALREFARHRNGKIGELIQTVDNVKSKLSNPMEKNYSFLQNLPDYVLALEIAKQIEEKNRELKSRLTKVSDAVRG